MPEKRRDLRERDERELVKEERPIEPSRTEKTETEKPAMRERPETGGREDVRESARDDRRERDVGNRERVDSHARQHTFEGDSYRGFSRDANGNSSPEHGATAHGADKLSHASRNQSNGGKNESQQQHYGHENSKEKQHKAMARHYARDAERAATLEAEKEEAGKQEEHREREAAADAENKQAEEDGKEKDDRKYASEQEANKQERDDSGAGNTNTDPSSAADAPQGNSDPVSSDGRHNRGREARPEHKTNSGGSLSDYGVFESVVAFGAVVASGVGAEDVSAPGKKHVRDAEGSESQRRSGRDEQHDSGREAKDVGAGAQGRKSEGSRWQRRQYAGAEDDTGVGSEDSGEESGRKKHVLLEKDTGQGGGWAEKDSGENGDVRVPEGPESGGSGNDNGSNFYSRGAGGSSRNSEKKTYRLGKKSEEHFAKSEFHRARAERLKDGKLGRLRGYRRKLEKGYSERDARVSYTNGKVNRRETLKQADPVRATLRKGHQKINEVQDENSAVEAAHKGERFAERKIGGALNRAYRRRVEKPWRDINRANERGAKEDYRGKRYEVEKSYREKRAEIKNSDGIGKKEGKKANKSNKASKKAQKKKIKREYASALRRTRRDNGIKKNLREKAKDLLADIGKKAVSLLKQSKTLLLIVLGAFLLFMVVSFVMVILSALMGVLGGGGLLGAYPAGFATVNEIDKRYGEMETDLKIWAHEASIAKYPTTEEVLAEKDLIPGLTVPEYKDKNGNVVPYKYNSVEVDMGYLGHNAFELLAYMSTKYYETLGEADDAELEGYLQDLFFKNYGMSLVTKIVPEPGATGTIRVVGGELKVTDAGGNIVGGVNVTLQVKAVVKQNILTIQYADIAAATAVDAEAGEELEGMFRMFFETRGLAQFIGNPFGYYWEPDIGQYYGFQDDHDASGACIKVFYAGLEAETELESGVYAGIDGELTKEHDSVYGDYVSIKGKAKLDGEDENEIEVKFAYLKEIKAAPGTVTSGTLVGVSTAKTRIEVIADGEYLNPLIFADTGYDPDDADIELALSSRGGYTSYTLPSSVLAMPALAAMVAEGEKYLGMPYKWGGKSPSTSFDCSGFVSWMINHSDPPAGSFSGSAQGLYNYCKNNGSTIPAINVPPTYDNEKGTTPNPNNFLSAMGSATPGDLVFFADPGGNGNGNLVTHVGLYVGDGMMLHSAGHGVTYIKVSESNYYKNVFYGFGRFLGP